MSTPEHEATDLSELTPEQRTLVERFALQTGSLGSLQERVVETSTNRAKTALLATEAGVPGTVLAGAANLSVQAVYKVLQAARKARAAEDATD